MKRRLMKLMSLLATATFVLTAFSVPVFAEGTVDGNTAFDEWSGSVLETDLIDEQTQESIDQQAAFEAAVEMMEEIESARINNAYIAEGPPLDEILESGNYQEHSAEQLWEALVLEEASAMGLQEESIGGLYELKTFTDEAFAGEERFAIYRVNNVVTGWEEDSSNPGKWWYKENGVKVSGWKYISGLWYYFDPNTTNHYMVHGWLLDGEAYYFMGTPGQPESGAMYTGGWLNDTEAGGTTSSPIWYYMNTDGKMHHGWLPYQGNRYYMGYPDAPMSGVMYNRGWLFDTDGSYYLPADGIAYTGKHTINGYVYTFSTTGKVILENLDDDIGSVQSISTDAIYRMQNLTQHYVTMIVTDNSIKTHDRSDDSERYQKIKFYYQGENEYIIKFEQSSNKDMVLTRSGNTVIASPYHDKSTQLWNIRKDISKGYYITYGINSDIRLTSSPGLGGGLTTQVVLPDVSYTNYYWNIVPSTSALSSYIYHATPKEFQNEYDQNMWVPIENMSSNLDRMGYNQTLSKNPTVGAMFNSLPQKSIVVFHGHGNIGGLSFETNHQWKYDENGNPVIGENGQQEIKYNQNWLCSSKTDIGLGSRTFASLSENSLNACQLMIFINCLSGRGGLDDTNVDVLSLMDAAQNKGVGTVVGFYNNIAYGEYYFDLVFPYLSLGYTLDYALDKADQNFMMISESDETAPHNNNNKMTLGPTNKHFNMDMNHIF